MCEVIELEMVEGFTPSQVYKLNKHFKRQGYKGLQNFIQHCIKISPKVREELKKELSANSSK